MAEFIKKLSSGVTKIIENSSIYAISRINNSFYGFCKILWFFAFFVSLIGSIYQVKKFYNVYFQFPIVINLRIDQKQRIEFPAISVCNLNRMKNINNSACILSEVSELKGTPLIFSERQILHSCKGTKNNTDIDAQKNSSLNFLNVYYKLSEEQRQKIGHSTFKLMFECSFNGKSCSETQKEPFVTFRYGNCITFNKRSNLHTSEIGVGSGLIFKLSLECFCNLPSTSIFGARIVIHDPKDLPNPEEDGFNLSPGYETSISMKKTVIQRLSSPYKDQCVNYKERSGGYPISKNDCIRKCIQEKNFAKCGCIDQTLGVMTNLSSCDITNETQSCCLDHVLENMHRYGPSCNCPLPCISVEYKSLLSRSVLPKDISRVKKFLFNVYKDNCIFKQENVKVNVFYSSLEELIYQQRPKWEIPELLSFLGNEFGIWLGLSLMIIFELIDKLISFCTL